MTLVADKFGRRISILIATAFVVIGNLLICLANSIVELMVGRVLIGITFGAQLIQIPIYNGELCQPPLRPFVGALSMMSLTSGFALSFIVMV